MHNTLLMSAFISLISSHLISSHLNSIHLNRVRCDWPAAHFTAHDQVCRSALSSDEMRSDEIIEVR